MDWNFFRWISIGFKSGALLLFFHAVNNCNWIVFFFCFYFVQAPNRTCLLQLKTLRFSIRNTPKWTSASESISWERSIMNLIDIFDSYNPPCCVQIVPKLHQTVGNIGFCWIAFNIKWTADRQLYATPNSSLHTLICLCLLRIVLPVGCFSLRVLFFAFFPFSIVTRDRDSFYRLPHSRWASNA